MTKKACAVGCVASLCLLLAWVPAFAATIAAGDQHGLAIKQDGTVWAWGQNSNGQLGDGTTTQRLSPVQVSGLTNVVAVAAGGSTSLALKADGSLWAWGLRPGNGASQSLVPVQVSLLSSVRAIAVGLGHALAVKADGTVWAWGSNTSGQLGDGSTTDSVFPVQVLSLSGVVSVGAGGSHSLAQKSDGSVWSWGSNAYGQLGDGTLTQRTSPVRVTALSSVVAVAGGLSHTVALKSDGTVWACGQNTYGQLGDGTTTRKTTPVQVSGLSGAATVSAGKWHSLVIKGDGSAWAWGQNLAGQLGDGTTTNKLTPVQVSGLTSGLSAAGGQGHSLALKQGGTVWAWGGNNFGQLGVGNTTSSLVPVQVASSGFMWMASTPTFAPAAGTYTAAQSVVLSSATPRATIRYTTTGADPTTSDPAVASGGTVSVSQNLTLKAKAWAPDVAASGVAAGDYHLKVPTPILSPGSGTYSTPQTVTITDPGASSYYTTDGSPPNQNSTNYTAPFTVGTLTTVNAAAYKSNWDPSDVGSATYTMNFGTLAAPTFSPVAGTYQSSTTVALSAATGATIYYTIDGSTPTTASPIYSVPLALSATTTIKAFAVKLDWTSSPIASGTFTIQVATPVLAPTSGSFAKTRAVALTTATPGATIRYTTNGLDPTVTDPVVPTNGTVWIDHTLMLKARAFKAGCADSAVASGSYTAFTASAAGGFAHSIVLDTTGTVWVWGANDLGQVGDGTTATPRLSPIQGLTGATAIAAWGGDHSVALKSDGTVWAWGQNALGQAGGATTPRTTATQVAGFPNGSRMVAVAAGARHSLALRDDGTVWAWGSNEYGQLGTALTGSGTPAQVAGLTGIVAIAAGQHHSLALKADGTVWAWGRNDAGQLGDGTTLRRTTPVQVPGLAGVVVVAGGGLHSLALKSDGTVWAWGDNSSSQLGVAGLASSLTPVQIAGLSASDIGAGGAHSLAAKADGTVWAWGDNSTGALGNGSGQSASTPIQISGLSGVMRVAAGQSHSLAITSDGTVWAWGANTNGQIGDGTSQVRRTPVKVSEPGFSWKAGTPVFGLAAGTYPSTQTVTLSSATGGTIYYTNDGSTPTTSSPSIPSGGSVSVNQTTTLKALASAASPYASLSNVSAATYTLKVAAPTLSPAGGTYGAPVSVTISSSTSGAEIHYTTNGVDPTQSDALVTGAVQVTPPATLKARAWKTGWQASDVAFGDFVIALATPTFTPPAGTYTAAQTVTIASTTGSTIHYTTNGIEPDEGSPSIASGGTVSVDRSMTLKAGAWMNGGAASAIASGTYAISLGTVATPTLSPAGGSYTAAQTVVLTSATSGAEIRYTLDGTTPTESSLLYSSPLVLTSSVTLKAKAFRANWVASGVGSGSFTITLSNTTATPVLSIPSGRYATSQTAIVTCATPGATIRYSLDGHTPTTSDPTIASGASIVIAQSLVLKAKAFTSGLADSAVARADYRIIGAAGAGWYHAIALKADGSVWAWGDDSYGQLGDGTTSSTAHPTPAAVKDPPGTGSLGGIKGIAAGGQHSLAIRADNTVVAWGYNANGQIGNGVANSTPVTLPAVVSGLTNVKAVAAGSAHSLALLTDGTVKAWGLNASGQLGDGTTTQRTTPVAVTGLPVGNPVVAIAAGADHSLALLADGTLIAWGQNADGEIGDGTTSNRSTPVAVALLKGVSRIDAGGPFSLALKSDGLPSGVLWAWGDNIYSQLGDGTRNDRLSPVSGQSKLIRFGAGNTHSVVYSADNRVWAWGSNFSGNLGDGSTTQRLVPVSAPGLSDVAEIAAGLDFTIVIKNDGSLWTWGANGAGQLADSTTVPNSRPSPGVVTGLSVANNAWLMQDPDGDGLPTGLEYDLGTDPLNADTNGDGISDGAELQIGLDPVSADTDGDGVSNIDEIARGTDPLKADTDGDGVPDGADCMPLDPTRSQCPVDPNDHTPPVITLLEPTNATPLP